MRLLLATQKDLIIRVERCVSGSNIPTLVIIFYFCSFINVIWCLINN